MKYTTVKVHGVIIAIGKTTEIEGYTESVLESVLPSDEELDAMSDEDQEAWENKNNKLMESICDFLNTNT